MTGIIKISGIVFLILVLLLTLKNVKSDMLPIFKICVTLLMCGMLIGMLSPIFFYINGYLKNENTERYVNLMIKALAITYISHITASISRDVGEDNIAAFCEMFGRVEIIILSLPIIDELISYAYELLSYA